jgi:putative ABC transport system ATP-binding protein
MTSTLTTATPAVRCAGVTKTYGQGNSAVRALRGIDLTVEQGELLMLVGPSGCGKTTLISVVAGVLDRDGGECTVLGNDFQKIGPGATTRFRAVNVGFVFQAFNLIPTLDIAENVSIPLLINGVPRREAMDRARAMLAKVGLGDRTRDVPTRLSGGQQQRVAIARALVHQPRLLVCDEPTSALDHATGIRVMELLREVSADHRLTLMVVTHDARIFEFADRIAEMDDGRITRISTGEWPPTPSKEPRRDSHVPDTSPRHRRARRGHLHRRAVGRPQGRDPAGGESADGALSRVRGGFWAHRAQLPAHRHRFPRRGAGGPGGDHRGPGRRGRRCAVHARHDHDRGGTRVAGRGGGGRAEPARPPARRDAP